MEGHISGIYLIYNICTEKIYVGSSNWIQQRWSNHISKLKKNIHANPHLQAAWNKYGESCFEFSILITFHPDICFLCYSICF